MTVYRLRSNLYRDTPGFDKTCTWICKNHAIPSLSDWANVYLGILAYRYGSVERKSGKSFTQLEYEKAVSLDREILIYMLDNNGFIQPKYIDFGENAQKLEQFKNELKKNHTVDFFKDPIDLKIKVYEN